MRKLTINLAAAAAVFATIASVQAQGPAAVEELKATVEEAYLYGLPMVVGYSVIYQYFVDAKSSQYKAPINTLHNEARVYTPKDTGISTPNSDTPYSMALLDLRAEPMVLCMPKIDKARYYDVQLVDLYSNNYGYMGSRTTGNGAGCYLVAGPDWKGQAPASIGKTFRSETQFSLAVYRTQLFDAADMPNVQKVQAGYSLKPLSAFAGTPAPAKAPEVKWLPFKPEAFSTDFAEYLNFLLQFAPATGTAAVEKPMRERFAKVGIGAGLKPSGAQATPQMKEAMGDAIKAALAKIKHAEENVGKLVNGWQIGSAAGSREFYNGNWALRAAAAKLGIYGNSEAEAVYPFTKHDANGIVLDGSKHTYQMTFPAGQLPPVNAFWSITMYDATTQLLIDNPINRYLINSPMLPGLKKNADGSLTIYVQKDSPGKDKESNWLPAPNGPMFVVMRMYWPKTEAPSVYPLGEGAWKPPALVHVRNLNSLHVRRFGDKSLENIVRTDTRYGGDPMFHGPRGWGYWNYLEYPKPVQNPNLWPDMQSSYLIGTLALPAGATLQLDYTYPRTRYFSFALYKEENNTFVSIGQNLTGPQIEPDPGSTNPFRVGANRLADKRHFTLKIVAQDAPADKARRVANTLYVGGSGGNLMFINRAYLSDQGSDGLGWGPADTTGPLAGLPTYSGALADGTRLSAAEVVKQFVRPMPAPKPPVTAQQWEQIVHAKGNDPALDPAAAPARKEPRWEKYWNIQYSILGSFKTPEERAKIKYAGPIDGGGDPETQYMFIQLSRKFGPVYVMRGKMPSFPNTYAGAGGKGLEVMPAAQTQYWSMVSCEAMPSSHIVDALTDFQVPLDKDGNYTIVYSRKEDRPANATDANGVAWIEWSPRGEGIDGPKNRADFGMLMIRIMATDPAWKQGPAHVTQPGMEEQVMGPYYPRGYYTTKAEFEAQGPNARPGVAHAKENHMKASTLLKLIGLLVVLALAYAVYKLGWSVIAPKVEQQVGKIGLTPNQVAANGPLPGDVSLYAKELACQQKIPTPGYYPSLNGAEISDSERSGTFPCATFLGSHDGPNAVYAWRSADDYPGIAYINNRKPGELYIIGGEVPSPGDPLPAGPYLAKADATTGKQIWRTYFDNASASGWFIGNTNLNILDNGKLALSWSNNALLVDGDTGLILKVSPLPTGEAPAASSNFKHLTIAPDRTLIYKSQTRPVGCTGQGTLGIIKCIQDGMKMPNSVMVAVHPDTLEVLDQFQLPEPAPSPFIITPYRDRIALYVGMAESIRRYFWDPATKKLSADPSWQIFPMQKGQTAATAPTVIGDWIVTQLNGAGSKEVSSSISAAHRDDAKRTQVIFPFGPMPKGGFSFAPPKAGADPENGMVYSADMGLGKVAGIKLDPATGEMKTAFVVDDVSSTFQPVIGPKDKRVLLLTNARQNVAKEPLMAAIFTNNYKEQLTWRDAATGRILAESDFFEPLTINSLTPPGFGGRVYFPTTAGKGFYVLQVMTKPAAAK